MESSKEKILREQIEKFVGLFDDYSAEEILANFPSEAILFLSHTLSDRKAKLKEGIDKLHVICESSEDQEEGPDLVEKDEVVKLIEEIL